MGSGVWGLGSGVWGLGFGVWGLGLRPTDPQKTPNTLKHTTGLGCRAWGFRDCAFRGCGIQGVGGCRVRCFRVYTGQLRLSMAL